MHLARAASLSGFEELVSGLGLNAGQLLRQAGLPDDVLSTDAADTYLPVASMEKIYALAEQASGQYNLAARLGSQQDLSSLLGVLGLVMQQSMTVGTALAELQKHFAFQITGAYIETSIEDDQLILAFVLQDTASLPSSRHTVEFALAAGISMLRSLCGQGWRPRYVQFMHAETRHSHALERYYYSTLYFAQERNAIVMAAADLQRQIESANPELRRILHQHLAQIEENLGDDPVQTVEKLIRQSLNAGRCDIERVASLMGVHRRTLHRLLVDQGTSFSAVLQSVRSDLACKMLSETSTELAQLADILCYSNASAFSRAFRGWYGCTPSEYRHRNGSDEQH